MAETALVILFPELEPLIGELRRRHTLNGARKMPPHVTLIYPFADTAELDPLVPVVAAELERFAPFDVAFRRTARFPGVLYLEPEPAQPFIAMTEALVAAFPAYPPYGGQFDEIVPHAGVASGDDALLDRLESDVGAGLPLVTRIERGWLMEDTPFGWRRHTPFPLDRHQSV
jgi:2'-5' RNA ligase